AALAGPVVDVVALGTGEPEMLLSDDLVVALRHADGSLSAVTYASGGPPSLAKERIEVVGRGRSAVIDDFRSVVLDGRRHRLPRQDKGHERLAREFRRAVLDGTPRASRSWPL